MTMDVNGAQPSKGNLGAQQSKNVIYTKWNEKTVLFLNAN